MTYRNSSPTTVTLLRGTALVLASCRSCPCGKGLDMGSETLLTGCVHLGRSLCPSEPLSSCVQMKMLIVSPCQVHRWEEQTWDGHRVPQLAHLCPKCLRRGLEGMAS